MHKPKANRPKQNKTKQNKKNNGNDRERSTIIEGERETAKGEKLWGHRRSSGRRFADLSIDEG